MLRSTDPGILADNPCSLSANDELIAITLEDCPRHFSVSKALLYNASDYFRKALDSGFMESSKRILRLPGCDEQTFNLFLYYTTKNALPDFKTLCADVCKSNPGWDGAHARRSELQCALVRLWTFGDAYLIPKLQNLAMKELINLLDICTVSSEAVNLAFETAAMDSPSRRVFVKECVQDYEELSVQDMDMLGALPGFFLRFTEQILRCPGKGCKHWPKCTPSDHKEYSRFYVKEPSVLEKSKYGAISN